MAKENFTPAQVAASLVVAFLYQARMANDAIALLETDMVKGNDSLTAQLQNNLETATKELQLVRDRIGRRVVEDQYSGEIREIVSNLSVVYPTIGEHMPKFIKDSGLKNVPQWLNEFLPAIQEQKVSKVPEKAK